MYEPPASCKQYGRPGDSKIQARLQLGLQTYNPKGRVMKWSLIELHEGIRDANNPINVNWTFDLVEAMDLPACIFYAA